MALASGTVLSELAFDFLLSELAFDFHANHQSRALGPDSESFITLRACALGIARSCPISTQTRLRYGT
jgi:hypothetical protein